MVTVIKRSLRESSDKSSVWATQSHLERLIAVEIINRLSEEEYAKQTFPRISRIIRKK
mgnify:CR=1 FL=1|tara:strand:+ start:260 stop:433 length:174 start_codon:yes stop_codon:yes gene_type:complete